MSRIARLLARVVSSCTCLDEFEARVIAYIAWGLVKIAILFVIFPHLLRVHPIDQTGVWPVIAVDTINTLEVLVIIAVYFRLGKWPNRREVMAYYLASPLPLAVALFWGAVSLPMVWMAMMAAVAIGPTGVGVIAGLLIALAYTQLKKKLGLAEPKTA